MDEDVVLLHRLLEHQDLTDPKGVTELAEAIGLSAPTLSRRLSDLHRRGWVDREEDATSTGRRVIYRVSSFASIRWASRHRGVARSWESDAEMEWEFPLVSQVPDGRARSTLVRYLRRLRREGLLDLDVGSREDASRNVHGPLVVAYGSTARGDARPDADVDLLIFLARDERDRYAEDLDIVAGQVSVGAPRPIQVDVAPMEDPGDAPTQIWDALRREGLIVYDGRRQEHELWKMIYGGRVDG